MSGTLLPLFATLALGALPTTVPKGEEPLIDVAGLHPAFKLDIRYATADNFAKVKAYPVARCLLRKTVAERMVKVQRALDEQYGETYGLLFKDCYRPNAVQGVLWDAVKGTKMARYVANPNTKTGSIHSYGAAVDLTLYARKTGKEIDMGTPYDHLGKLAEPRHEVKYLMQGKLTKAQVDARLVLRKAMVASGMRVINNEWWHFNAYSNKRVRKKYSRLNVPLRAVD